MHRIGRRAGFTLGAIFGIVGVLICAYAPFAYSFWFLCGGALVLGTYKRAQVQGLNDLFIVVPMAVSSFASGLLFALLGWSVMNRLAVPFLLFVGGALVWLAVSQRRAEAYLN